MFVKDNVLEKVLKFLNFSLISLKKELEKIFVIEFNEFC